MRISYIDCLSILVISFGANSLASSGPVHSELESGLRTYCLECHGNKKAKGGLNLATLLTQKPLIRNLTQWSHVIDLLSAKEMPPEEEEQPSKEMRARLLNILDQELNHFDYSKIDNPGFEHARRLSNLEYNNTIRDLFGIDLKPAERFPSELTGSSGFENSANTLFLQPALMERYIAAAERIVELTLPNQPESPEHKRARALIFIANPNDTFGEDQAAATIFKRFLQRAFRRPTISEELDRIQHQFKLARNSGQEFHSAIKQGIQAALISPNFLLRIETGQNKTASYRVNDWELASRLSYFLWASMPDQELFNLAVEGTLRKPHVLDAQIERMLKDPRADSLGSVFAAQWLGFRLIGNRVRFDPIDNPWCTDSLMAAMRAESAMFFVSLLRDDRSIDELVTADYTFMNEELANEIYANDQIKGSQMRRVSLKDHARGGILTHGSIMAITSNYKETSPIKRGNWILETVLGKPLPPPPPNAGAFNEEVRENDSLTFREKVELHSSNPSCRSCHSKIDPLGFSLENFDYFGRWRENYRVRVTERNDDKAFGLVTALRKLEGADLETRIEDLDIGSDTRKEILEWLTVIRSFKDHEVRGKVIETMTTSKQAQLVRILSWMEVGETNEEDPELLELLVALRELDQEELEERIGELEVDTQEMEEIREHAAWIRGLTVEALKSEFVELLDPSEQDEVVEILLAMELDSAEEEEEEDRWRRRRYELKPVDTQAFLPDGTPFSGPAGLKKVLIEKHRDDLARQVVSKMLAYALGRQLEYYDEPAIRKIIDELKANGYRFQILLKSIAMSYPFNYKKNPEPEITE